MITRTTSTSWDAGKVEGQNRQTRETAKAKGMQIINIDSIDDERVAAYGNLTELQLRNRLEPAKGLFIAESPKVIDRALAAGREPISLLVEQQWLEGMTDMFARIDHQWGSGIPVYVASSEQLRRLTGYRLHRGALAAMRRWPLPSIETVCRGARRIAVMENIVDHTNVGALMRSAAALDVDAVLVTPSCGDPLYRRAARVSMGTVFQVPWTRICEQTLDCDGSDITENSIDTWQSDNQGGVRNPQNRNDNEASTEKLTANKTIDGTVSDSPNQATCGSDDDRHTKRQDKRCWPDAGMAELKRLGFTTVAMALSDDSITLDELVHRLNNEPSASDHIDKLALIFGTEGDGLTRRTIADTDLTVKIPMSNGVDSLNVAASSALTFYATRVRN